MRSCPAPTCFAGMPRCRWIGMRSWRPGGYSGSNRRRPDWMLPTPATVTWARKSSLPCASGVLADQVSEQAMALLLSLLRGLPTFFRAQQVAHEFASAGQRATLHR